MCGCREGISAASDGQVLLTWTRDASALDAVRQRAEEAAAAAAVSNAETSRALEYNMQTVASSEREALAASVVVATAAGIAKVNSACPYASLYVSHLTTSDYASLSSHTASGSDAEIQALEENSVVILKQGECDLQENIVDTTGAGDAFIGSMVYGIATGLDPKRCLLLAAVVAATKCTAVGARSGLPHAHRIQSHLLH